MVPQEDQLRGTGRPRPVGATPTLCPRSVRDRRYLRPEAIARLPRLEADLARAPRAARSPTRPRRRVVEHGAAADEGEDLVARLEDALVVLTSVASWTARLTSRPLMPPGSLHQPRTHRGAVPQLLVQTGRRWSPLSEMRADLIAVVVTPVSVSPASPGPHTGPRSPNIGPSFSRVPSMGRRRARSRRCVRRLLIRGLGFRRDQDARRGAGPAISVAQARRRRVGVRCIGPPPCNETRRQPPRLVARLLARSRTHLVARVPLAEPRVSSPRCTGQPRAQATDGRSPPPEVQLERLGPRK